MSEIHDFKQIPDGFSHFANIYFGQFGTAGNPVYPTDQKSLDNLYKICEVTFTFPYIECEFREDLKPLGLWGVWIRDKLKE